MISMEKALSGRIIAANSLLNMLGLTAPLAVGLVTIPLIIEGFGLERFGFLTLSWAIIGYFTLFDLGLSRALTYSIAQYILTGDYEKRAELAWSSLQAMLFFGILGAAGLFVLSEPVVANILKVSADHEAEFILSLKVLSLAVPVTIVSTGLKGILEAHQSFFYINVIQSLMGSLNFIAPLLTLQISRDITLAIGALFVIRIMAFFLYILACFKAAPETRQFRSFNAKALKGQLSYGGWITVSTVIGPVMVYFDRFIIASMLSVSVVAYYTTPYEIVSKVTLIAVAIAGAVFPTLSAFSSTDRPKTIAVLDKAIRYVLVIVFPIALIFIAFAHTGLKLWLSSDFADRSATLLQWLAVGVFLNCIAFMPYGFLQAHRRPDITAKLHLLELPLYLIALVLLIEFFGILGAAIAWALRAGIDGILLFIMCPRIVPESLETIKRNGFVAALSLLTLGVFAALEPVWYAIGIGILLYVLASWFLLLTDRERMFLRKLLSALPYERKAS